MQDVLLRPGIYTAGLWLGTPFETLDLVSSAATLEVQDQLSAVPDALSDYNLTLGNGGTELIYDYDTQAERTGVARLLGELSRAGIRIRDLQTTQSSLEDIFVGLVSDRK